MEFSLKDYLEERKGLIDHELALLLDHYASAPPPLDEALRHAVLSGGKRVRPILTLAVAEALSGTYRPALKAALAVELLHTYTLVHDDLPSMDNDLLRRGLPTVHAKFGEAMAVLCGDALQTIAFETIAQSEERTAGTVAELVATLARAAGPAGVIAGQVEDIRHATSPSLELIQYVFRHKTADLFKGACCLGALVAGADQEQCAAIASYATGLGVAFQIVDDLLDARERKAAQKIELSCLDVMDEAAAREWAACETARAVAALERIPGDTRPLSALAAELLQRIH